MTATRKAGASKPATPKASTARSSQAPKPTSRTVPKAAASGRTPRAVKSNAAAAKPTVAAKPAAARKRTVAAGAAPPPLPLRVTRRAIFIDVENTSSEITLARVLEHLKIDRTTQPTDLTAMGNWKAVGVKLARMLASAGAHLIHSAPAGGVRDWSDLAIAVAAGRWLALAAPGDHLDLVSEDRAFDAVGDAAAAAGVVFRRLSYRHLSGPEPVPAQPAAAEAARRPQRRGGRRRRRSTGAMPVRSGAAPTESPPVAEAPVPSAPTAAEREEAHTASLEQIRTTLARLSGGEADRWINLDALANALRTEGFSRPPGSPRLITRLRSIPGVEVSANGMVHLLSVAPPPAASPEGTAPPDAAPTRARRTGSRGRSRRGGSRGRSPQSAAPENAEGAGEPAAPDTSTP